HAGRNAVRISTGLDGRLAHHAKTGRIGFGGRAQRKPAIEYRAREAQHARSAATQPDWRPAGLKRRRLQLDAWIFIAPQSLAALDLAKHRVARAVASATNRAQLGMGARQLSPGADCDNEPTLGDAVERGQ